jgi:hypothetical protein
MGHSFENALVVGFRFGVTLRRLPKLGVTSLARAAREARLRRSFAYLSPFVLNLCFSYPE